MKPRVESQIAAGCAGLGALILISGWLMPNGHLYGFNATLLGVWVFVCALVIESLPFKLPRWEVLLVCLGLTASSAVIAYVGVIDVQPEQVEVAGSPFCPKALELREPGAYKLIPDGCEVIQL